MEKIQVLGQREREAKPAIQQVTPVCEHSQAALRLYRPESGEKETVTWRQVQYCLLVVISGPTS